VSPPPPSEQALARHDADDELVARAQQGDRVAMEVLLRRHQDLVWRVCRRICTSEADALDAMQEALVAVVRRIDRFDGRSSFTTWLYRVATNAALDELRRRRRRPEPSDLVSHDRSDTVATVDATAALADRMVLDAAIAALAPEFRAPLVLRDVEGLDYAAIATVLDIPPGTVRSRISRARSLLARELGASGNFGGSTRRQTVEPRSPDTMP
jgi:RNA polymerase sigma-70 factor (ECF subfamily)